MMKLTSIFLQSSGTIIVLCSFLGRPASSQDTSAGTFSFPQTGSKSSYNSLDTLNVSWSTSWSNFTDPYLMFWVGSPPQQLVLNQSVPSSGSKLVSLDFGNAFNDSNFVLQHTGVLNVGAPFYLSGSFFISNDRSLEPLTLNLAPTTSTVAAASASNTGAATTSGTGAVTPAGTTTSASRGPQDPTIGGLIAVIVVAACLLALLLGLGLWHIRRLRARVKIGASSLEDSPLPKVHELDQTTHSNSTTAVQQSTWNRFFGFLGHHKRSGPQSLPELACTSCGAAIRNVSELNGLQTHELPASAAEKSGKPAFKGIKVEEIMTNIEQEEEEGKTGY